MPVNLLQYSKLKISEKIPRNQNPELGYGYIYAIEHVRYVKKSKVDSGFYIGLTTRSLQERWKEHIQNSLKETWKPNSKPLYSAIRIIAGKERQLLNKLEDNYLIFEGLEKVNLMDLEEAEKKYITMYGGDPISPSTRMPYSGNLVRLKSYNMSKGGESAPITPNRITKEELIIAAYEYIYGKEKKIKEIQYPKHKGKNEENRAENIRQLIKERTRSKFKPRVETVMRVLKIYLTEIKQGLTVGDYISFAFSGEKSARGLERKTMLTSLFGKQNAKNKHLLNVVMQTAEQETDFSGSNKGKVLEDIREIYLEKTYETHLFSSKSKILKAIKKTNKDTKIAEQVFNFLKNGVEDIFNSLTPAQIKKVKKIKQDFIGKDFQKLSKRGK